MADPSDALTRAVAQAVGPVLIQGRGSPITRSLTIGRLARDTALRLGWTPPPADDGTCRHCGRDNHGMPCQGMLRAAGLWKAP